MESMTFTEEDSRWLSDDVAQRILAEYAGKPESPSMISRLRNREGLSIVRCALILEQLRVRQRAGARFPKGTAQRMAGTIVGLEQATDAWIAAYKANRLARWSHDRPGPVPVKDFCCGIGGDTMALGRLFQVTGVERDPYTAWAARWNLAPVAGKFSSRILRTDVTTVPVRNDEVIHIDPDRRSGGRGRTTYLGAYEPDLKILNRMRNGSSRLVMKLAPGSVAPSDWAMSAELEWISRDRECRQQLVWGGDLTEIPGQRRATVVFPERDVGTGDPEEIPSYRFRTITGRAGIPRYDSTEISPTIGEWIVEPDVSVLAADLTGEVAARLHAIPLTPDGAYLTMSPGNETGWSGLPIRIFERLEILPNDPGRLRSALKAHGIGRLEIKVRCLRGGWTPDRESGVPGDPQLAIFGRRLKLRGDREAVLFVLGTASGGRLTFLARRIPFPFQGE
ncbi:MAG: hypothetical protein Q4C47_08770 [Planctomycetia bacterium]|nr:hypothetical protein [Planctomycetia bacterium]